MNVFGKWVGIQCYKHDGNLHRCWDRGFVVFNNADFVIVATKKAKVVESNGRRWFTKEPAVTIFSKKEWWNVICMIKPEGICYYCNIASPCLIENDLVKYIDYDLDAKLFPDGNIRVLDEKEYAHHRSSYKYSDDLDTVLRYQTNEIIKLMKERKFPFDNEQILKYYDKFLSMTNKNKE